jgi:transcriptional regulator of acetoin/glycerol metabolism
MILINLTIETCPLGDCIEMNDHDYCVPDLATEEKMKAIYKLKQELIETGNVTQEPPFLRQEVLKSWKRSLAYGLNPKHMQPVMPIPEEEFKDILQKKQALINAAQPLLSASECLASVSRYLMCLADENGLHLLTAGDRTVSRAMSKYVNGLGGPLDEKHFGTTAHVLVHHTGKPVQLVGPENFFYCLDGNISSSAPIFDKNNQLVGTLTFILEETPNPFSEESHFLQANALGWVIFMAQVISIR